MPSRSFWGWIVAASCAAALGSPCSGQPLFPAPVFDTSDPNFPALGDLNGDGKKDLVTLGSGTVSVRLGNGDGTFLPETRPSAGSSSKNWVIIDDLNGDGRKDLAIATSSFSVTTLLGNGNGTFGPPSFPLAGAAQVALVACDFNGDGKRDLVTANYNGDNISLLPGNGDGTFGSPTLLPAGDQPAGIAVGDLNSDGHPDLAVPSFFSANVSIFLGNGSGFAPGTFLAVGSGPKAVILADFNADGKLDLAVANQNSDDLSIRLGQGNGTFGPETRMTAVDSPIALVLGNFDGDSIKDLVVLSFTTGNIGLFSGNPDGTFDPLVQFPSQQSSGSNSLAAAELNGDGKDDLVASNGGPASMVAVFLARGDGTFLLATGIPIGDASVGSHVAVGNFNGDSYPDLVASLYTKNKVSLLLGHGDGTFTAAATFEVGFYPQSFAIADFNGDTKADLAVPNEGSDTVSVLLGNGLGGFAPQTEFATGDAPWQVAVADFNADGKIDLAVSNQFTDNVSVLLGNGNGSFAPHVTYPVGALPRGIVAGDFDGDGKQDLATANRTGGDISFLSGNGDGTFQPAASISLGFNVGRPSPLLSADFNSDGKLDLAVGGDSTSAVWVVLGNGDGTFQASSATQTSRIGTPVGLSVGDFNGDGVTDIVTTEYFTDSVSVVLGVGDGSFTPRSMFQGGPSVVSVAAADFNGDGWQDLVTADDGSSSLFLLLNQAPFPGVCNDADGDGFGFPGDPSCPRGAVSDCNDAAAAIFPGAVETCDGVDNNCDFLDGHDQDLDTFTTCTGDCNDTRRSIHPGAREFCNGIDEDCNGTVDVPGEEAKNLAFGSDGALLTWNASAGFNVTYNVYRGDLPAAGFSYNQTCFQSSLTQPSTNDGQVPALGHGFHYLVTGRNSCGEGTLGSSSGGSLRPNPLPCP